MNSLDSRYGRSPASSPATSKRLLMIVLGCVVVVITVGAAFLAFRPQAHPHAPETSNFTTHDAANASLQFTIVPDATRDIRCEALAKNQYEAIVGYKEVVIPADPSATSASIYSQRVDIRTTQRAAQGHVESCVFLG